MARAIKAVLANRKMFRGGGLTDTAPAASGILSSSSPLIDAVTADAVNPQGGGTLSMNQGGVAKFQDGGAFSAHRPGIGAGQVSVRPDLDANDPMTGITSFGPGATPDLSYRRRAGDIALPPTTIPGMEGGYGTSPDMSTSQSRYESQFPYSAQLDESFWSLAPPLKDFLPGIDSEEAKSPIEYAALSIPSLIRNLARGVGQITRAGVPHFAAAANWLVQNQDSDHLSVAKLKELYTMMMRQPEYTGQIQSISDELMSSDAGQNMDAEEFKLSVSDELYKQQYQRASSMQGIGEETDLPPLPTMPGYLGHAEGTETRPWEDTLIDPADPSVATGFTSMDQSVMEPMPTVSERLQAETDPETQLQTRMQILGGDMPVVSEDLEAYYNVIASGDGAAQQAFIEDLKARKGQEYVAMLLAKVDEFGDKAPADVVIDEVIESAEKPAEKDLPAITAEDEVKAVVADEITAGKVEAGAVVEPPGHAVEVQNLASPGEPPTIYDRKALIEKLQREGTGVDPDAQWAGLADVLKQIGQKSEGTGDVDIDTLKAEIEALMPKVENDPSMAGLNTILLGAAIAGGTSSNPWTNIANGVTQQLPNIIKYRASLTEAKRARETAIAKLAIEQKLGIQSEQRAEARQISAEQRGFAIDISKTLFEKSIEEEQYSVARPTFVDAAAINPDATGKVLIPALTPFSLTNDQLDFFSDNNIPLMRTDKLTASDISDILGQAESSFTPEQWNQMVKTETGNEIFGNFLEGAKYTAYIPKPGAKELLAGDPSLDKWTRRWVDDQTVYQVQGYYDRAIKTHRDLWAELEELKTYTTVGGGLTGPQKLWESLGSAMQGLASAPDSPMAQVANYILGGKELSDYDAFEAKGRMILAKIAPLLLGESGKTISDTDRVMVARAIGMNIWQNEQGVWQLTAKNPFTDVLKAPGAIENAIAETQAALGRAVEEANKEMANFYITNGRRVPEKELLQYEAAKEFELFMDLREG